MSSDSKNILERALARERAARKQAEKILEEKSAELYSLNQELLKSKSKLEGLVSEKTSQLEGIFENIVDAYVVMDTKGTVLKMNEAASNLFGYDLEKETINVVKLIHKEDYIYAMESYEKLMNEGHFTNYQARVYTKKKQVKWVHINASLVYDSNNKPIAAQGIVRDITTEREKSLMLEVINEVARSVLGKVDIHKIAWEITHKIAEYLGTKDCVIYMVHPNQNELIQIAAYGDKLTDKGEIRNKISIPMGAGIVGAVAKTGEATIIKDTSKDQRYIKDDDERFSEITVPILFDDEVIAIIDSEHPQKEYFTKDHLRTLENIAGLVALQLKNAIVIKDREIAQNKNVLLLHQLEKNNEELQEYAHVVSHDLKSPLRSIYALISWIKEDNQETFDVQSLENISLIEGTLERMENLISGILNYSSINNESLVKENIDLNVLLQDVLHLVYIPKHITFRIKKKLPSIQGDGTRLIQLFQNLISNAVRYNDKEKGMITLDFTNESTHYRFSLQDNGMGIAKKYHKKIFKMFQSINNHNESTGIGLSIVKKIVDLHHGEVQVESKKGTGTTFYFTLRKF